MRVWKFGCNWSGNANSFYEFIRDEKIVIGYQPHTPFRLDDMVLVSSGFLVRAIVQVDEAPKSITESDFRFVTNPYGIEWASTTLYAKAEWYELSPNLQFHFRCQQGAVRVRKKEILAQTKELWDRR